MYFGEFQLKTKYLRFWGVRGRKRAPEPIKRQELLLFLHVGAKVHFLVNLRNSCEIMILMHFMENRKILRNNTKIQKISVLHNSVILHETFVYPRPNGWSRAMGPRKPGNYQNSSKFN